jgi:hypothetical protein
LGGRVPQGRALSVATDERVGVSMPSLGGRVPQGDGAQGGDARRAGFNALFGRTGPAGTVDAEAIGAALRGFNALFGRTGPAGITHVCAAGCAPEFQCPLWADGSRRLVTENDAAWSAGCFNALFGRTGPAGQGVSDWLYNRSASFNALFGRTGPAGHGRRRLGGGPRGVSMPSLGGRVPQVPPEIPGVSRRVFRAGLPTCLGPPGPPPCATLRARCSGRGSDGSSWRSRRDPIGSNKPWFSRTGGGWIPGGAPARSGPERERIVH